MKKPSTVLVVCATIVACVAIAAVAVLTAVGADGDTIALLIGLVGLLITNLIGMGRTEQIKGTIDDLSNGKMDAKIRAGVAEVLAPHLVDPRIEDQLDHDYQRRSEGHA